MSLKKSSKENTTFLPKFLHLFWLGFAPMKSCLQIISLCVRHCRSSAKSICKITVAYRCRFQVCKRSCRIIDERNVIALPRKGKWFIFHYFSEKKGWILIKNFAKMLISGRFSQFFFKTMNFRILSVVGFFFSLSIVSANGSCLLLIFGCRLSMLTVDCRIVECPWRCLLLVPDCRVLVVECWLMIIGVDCHLFFHCQCPALLICSDGSFLGWKRNSWVLVFICLQ